MVDNNDELFREVEEELRRERYERLWKQYGHYVIGVAATIVIVVAGYKYWEHYNKTATESAGANFETAMQAAANKKFDDATAELTKITKEAPTGYATLAELALAGTALQDGKPSSAEQALAELSDRSAADPLLKDYAKLQAAALNIGKQDFTEIKNQLSPLMGETGPWRHLAKEYLATAAIKANKTDEAREVLTNLLADSKLPRQARERINRMLGMIAAADLAAGNKKSADAPPAANATKGESKADETKDSKPAQ